MIVGKSKVSVAVRHDPRWLSRTVGQKPQWVFQMFQRMLIVLARRRCQSKDPRQIMGHFCGSRPWLALQVHTTGCPPEDGGCPGKTSLPVQGPKL